MQMMTDLPAERKKLIRMELKSHGVGEPDPFNQFNRLVEAFYRVMTARPHENQLLGTGVVLASHPFEQYGVDNKWYNKPEILRVGEEQLESCWRLADGVNSFVLIDPKGHGLLLFDSPITDELDLFTLRDDALSDRERGRTEPATRECLIIKRSDGVSSRRLTLLCHDRIIALSGLSYVSKPYQYETLQALKRGIDPFPWYEHECLQTVKSVLRIAMHQLSPKGIGTTIVVLAPDDVSKLEGLVNSGALLVHTAIAPPEWFVTERRCQRPLVHLMAQKDGASTILPNGHVRYVGAFFPSVASSKNNDSIHEYGSRHLSALEFSKSIEGMVVVISSDGPVTIFSKGSKITTSPRSNESAVVS